MEWRGFSDTLAEGVPEDGANLLRILRVGDYLSSFLGSPGDPPLPRNPPANACTFESGTLPCLSPVFFARWWRRRSPEKGMHFGSDSAGYGRSECEWKKRSATSLAARRLLKTRTKGRTLVEERPGGRVRSADSPPSLLSEEKVASYGRSQERECLR